MKLSSTGREAIDRLKNHFSKTQISERDADLDRDPYMAAAWGPMTLSNGATGTIDWVVTFGLPEIPKSVSLIVAVRDAASAGGNYLIDFKAKVTTTNVSLEARTERALNDGWRSAHGPVAVADNGTTYYRVIASGVNTMDVYIRVVQWVKG